MLLFACLYFKSLSTVCLLFQIISYDSPRGGVSVITEKGDVTASFLVVQHAKPTDSGTYSCSPSLGDTVSVNVHVLRGNYPFSSVKNKFIFLPFLVIWTGKPGLVSALAEKNIIEIVDRYIFLPKIVLFASEFIEDFP